MNLTKAEARKQIKSQLRDIDLELLAEYSTRASKLLMQTDAYSKANLILAYKAMKRECDPVLAVKAAYEAGKRVAFPLCAEGNSLIICLPNDASAFNVGAYGILEPDLTRSSIISPDELDLVIVPALAFDRELNRLGRGAGYYDRLLAKTHATTLGFAFPQQLLPSVPHEELDIKVNGIISADEYVH